MPIHSPAHDKNALNLRKTATVLRLLVLLNLNFYLYENVNEFNQNIFLLSTGLPELLGLTSFSASGV